MKDKKLRDLLLKGGYIKTGYNMFTLTHELKYCVDITKLLNKLNALEKYLDVEYTEANTEPLEPKYTKRGKK